MVVASQLITHSSANRKNVLLQIFNYGAAETGTARKVFFKTPATVLKNVLILLSSGQWCCKLLSPNYILCLKTLILLKPIAFFRMFSGQHADTSLISTQNAFCGPQRKPRQTYRNTVSTNTKTSVHLRPGNSTRSPAGRNNSLVVFVFIWPFHAYYFFCKSSVLHCYSCSCDS